MLHSHQSIHTTRLILRPFCAADQEPLFALYGDPEVMTIRKIGAQTREQSDLQLGIILQHWQGKGFGLRAVVDRASGIFLGECGLREHAPGADGIELSYGFLPKFWGQGFASEAARAAIDDGFSGLGLDEIFGVAKNSNHASLRVLNKLGFEFEYAISDGVDTVIRTALSRQRWFEVQRCGATRLSES